MINYSIEYKFAKFDKSTFSDALTKAQLGDEIEYLLDLGYYIVGVHDAEIVEQLKAQQ